MCRARVYKENQDWMMCCKVHNECVMCADWQDAVINAYGHAAFFTRPIKPVWEISVSDGIHRSEVVVIAQRNTV